MVTCLSSVGRVSESFGKSLTMKIDRLVVAAEDIYIELTDALDGLDSFAKGLSRERKRELRKVFVDVLDARNTAKYLKSRLSDLSDD